MDPLSAIASIGGIVSLGIQVAQILQKEIDAIASAEERLQQMVIELQATAHCLQDLEDFFVRDQATTEPIINDQGKRDFGSVIQQCNLVFRRVTTIIAKAGRAVLATIDDFQRQVNRAAINNGQVTTTLTLTFELSHLDHLTWPWKLPKIEQCIADLDRLKHSLGFRLTVAILAQVKKQSLVPRERSDPASLDGHETEIWKDKLFYQYMDLKESENKSSPRIGADALTKDETSPKAPKQAENTARELIESWPHFPNGEVPTADELYALGIVLQGIAINPTDCTSLDVPVNVHTLRERVLRNNVKGKVVSVWETFKKLSRQSQLSILHAMSPVFNLHPSLLSLEVEHHHSQRLADRLKTLTPFRAGPGPERSTIFMVIAWVDHKGHAPRREYYEGLLPTPLTPDYLAHIGNRGPWGPPLPPGGGPPFTAPRQMPLPQTQRIRRRDSYDSESDEGHNDRVIAVPHSRSKTWSTPYPSRKENALEEFDTHPEDDLLPTEAEKTAVMERYLRKWTTIYQWSPKFHINARDKTPLAPAWSGPPQAPSQAATTGSTQAVVGNNCQDSGMVDEQRSNRSRTRQSSRISADERSPSLTSNLRKSECVFSVRDNPGHSSPGHRWRDSVASESNRSPSTHQSRPPSLLSHITSGTAAGNSDRPPILQSPSLLKQARPPSLSSHQDVSTVANLAPLNLARTQRRPLQPYAETVSDIAMETANDQLSTTSRAPILLEASDWRAQTPAMHRALEEAVVQSREDEENAQQELLNLR
ncbi:MAG: hypothetical protein Q9217_006274 [Psora testacea]